MSKRFKPNVSRNNDWRIFCQMCGTPCNASESVKQPKFSGNDGKIVCPNCADPVDYGMVPYKIGPDKRPSFVAVDHYHSNPDDVPDAAEPLTDDDDFRVI